MPRERKTEQADSLGWLNGCTVSFFITVAALFTRGWLYLSRQASKLLTIDRVIELREEHYDQMIQYNIINEQYVPDVVQFEGKERPPMIEIPEYCQKYNLA